MKIYIGIILSLALIESAIKLVVGDINGKGDIAIRVFEIIALLVAITFTFII